MFGSYYLVSAQHWIVGRDAAINSADCGDKAPSAARISMMMQGPSPAYISVMIQAPSPALISVMRQPFDRRYFGDDTRAFGRQDFGDARPQGTEIRR